MTGGRAIRIGALVLGTALVLTAAPAVARTVVDYARNAGHVDGLRAVSADTSVHDRAGKLVATNAHGELPNGIIHRARDSARLGGIPATAYQQACSPGTIAGFAQVPGDVGAQWTQVAGYGHSIFTVGPVRQGYPPFCRPETAFARHVSTGLYQVALNSTLASLCQGADVPPAGQPLPAVVSVTSPNELVATYTTVCDPQERGFEEQVAIATPGGVPTDAGFTIATLEPVQVAEP